VLLKDTGFQGYEPDHIATYQPKKKPRGADLTPADKAENTMISRIRILVEQVIAGVKRCHIVQDMFRNTTAHCEDLVMEVACGLHNFRARSRYASAEYIPQVSYSR
jgi:DDE superfamily endonuclease